MLSQIKRKYVILDRDGVIIADKGYVHRPEDLEFLPGAIDGLKALQNQGYELIIATNQAGVARGLYTEAQARSFQKELENRLAAQGVKIKKTYFCFHHPEFTGSCDCRKPMPRLAQEAALEFDFDLKDTTFVGDKDSEIAFGKNCGGLTCLVGSGQYPITLSPDYRIKNLTELPAILQTQTTPNSSTEPPVVAILLPTINRPEFAIRQLRYYASISSPHPLYIGDSSTQEYAQRLQTEIANLQGKLRITYLYCPELDDRQTVRKLLETASEKYACYIGDDDYQIQNSLTECAKFLETHPDYATAHGRALTFKLGTGKEYGNLMRLAPYHQSEAESETAVQRLLQFFKNYYVTQFSVHRREQMLTYYQNIDDIPDKSFSAELLPCALAVIDGKSKELPHLGFVRQTHDVRYELPNPFDWITSELWGRSYQIFENLLTTALAKKDRIPAAEARIVVRKSFWAYLQYHLAANYQLKFPQTEAFRTSWKKKLTGHLPFLKPLYRLVFQKPVPLHHLVQDPRSSAYHQAFQEILRSITGQLQ